MPTKCYNCGKEMKHGTEYSWTTDLGSFVIPCSEDEYCFCDCGEERLAYSLCLRIEKTEQDAERKKNETQALEEAVKWLEKNQLYPNLVNENAVANEIKFGKSDKISALIYIDDRNYGGLKVPNPKTFFDEFEKENN